MFHGLAENSILMRGFAGIRSILGHCGSRRVPSCTWAAGRVLKNNGSRRMRELGHFWVTHSIVVGSHAIAPKPWQSVRFAAHLARQGMTKFPPENCWPRLTLCEQRASIAFQKSSLLGHTVSPTVNAQNPTETMAKGRYSGWKLHDRHERRPECVEST